jgi:hypothetical protein
LDDQVIVRVNHAAWKNIGVGEIRLVMATHQQDFHPCRGVSDENNGRRGAR